MVTSVALAALLAGNAAAFQLADDGPGTNVRLVTPRHDPRLDASQYLQFKLATTAGRNVLIYG